MVYCFVRMGQLLVIYTLTLHSTIIHPTTYPGKIVTVDHFARFSTSFLVPTEQRECDSQEILPKRY
jgi:hypothetical protein